MAQFIAGIGGVFFAAIFFGGTIAVLLVALGPLLILVGLVMLIVLSVTYKRKRKDPNDPFAL